MKFVLKLVTFGALLGSTWLLYPILVNYLIGSGLLNDAKIITFEEWSVIYGILFIANACYFEISRRLNFYAEQNPSKLEVGLTATFKDAKEEYKAKQEESGTVMTDYTRD